MKKNDTEWSSPEWLGSNINSEADDIYPSLTKEGKLYFSSGRIGKNNRDIFYAIPELDNFKNPIRLDDKVNAYWEGDIFVSANEDYLVFASYGRKTGSGLYISFTENGQWTIPQRLEQSINTTGREFCPIVSPDGKYFFFTSTRTKNKEEISVKLTYDIIKERFSESYKHPQQGKTDVYWVKTEIFEKYKNKDDKSKLHN